MANQPKRFQKKVEDFVCEHCTAAVQGSGYTNHCPACLWSKHVDVNPGDRGSECGGLMEPIKVERRNDEYMLTQHCIKCGHERRNRLGEEDNFTAAVAIVL